MSVATCSFWEVAVSLYVNAVRVSEEARSLLINVVNLSMISVLRIERVSISLALVVFRPWLSKAEYISLVTLATGIGLALGVLCGLYWVLWSFARAISTRTEFSASETAFRVIRSVLVLILGAISLIGMLKIVTYSEYIGNSSTLSFLGFGLAAFVASFAMYFAMSLLCAPMILVGQRFFRFSR